MFKAAGESDYWYRYSRFAYMEHSMACVATDQSFIYYGNKDIIVNLKNEKTSIALHRLVQITGFAACSSARI